MRNKFFMVAATMAFLAMGCETVEPGHVAVMTKWGEISPGTWPSGTYGQGPGTDFHPMNIRTQSFDMIGSGGEHEGRGAGTVKVITRDQLSIDMDVSVQYHLNPDHANPVFRAFGADYGPTLIHSQVRTAVRDAGGQFRAMDLVDQRHQLQTAIETEVARRINTMLRQQRVATNAIVLDGVLVRNIDLPQTLDDAIANLQRERMQTQQRQQAALTAAQEAQRLQTEASGQIAAGLIRTRGNAEAKRIEAEAEADSNRRISASLTPELIRMRAIEAQRAVLSNSNTRTVFLAPNMNLFGGLPGLSMQ